MATQSTQKTQVKKVIMVQKPTTEPNKKTFKKAELYHLVEKLETLQDAPLKTKNSVNFLKELILSWNTENPCDNIVDTILCHAGDTSSNQYCFTGVIPYSHIKAPFYAKTDAEKIKQDFNNTLDKFLFIHIVRINGNPTNDYLKIMVEPTKDNGLTVYNLHYDLNIDNMTSGQLENFNKKYGYNLPISTNAIERQKQLDELKYDDVMFDNIQLDDII